MSKLEFSPLYASSLSINDAFPLFKTSIEVTVPYRIYLGPVEHAALDQFVTYNAAFGKQANKSKKSAFSNDLKVLEKERMSFWSEVNRITNSYIKSADPTKKAAAEILEAFLYLYSSVEDLPLNSKTGTITELMGKYRVNISLQQAAATMGLDSSFAGIEIKNTAYDVLYKSRIDESAAREKSSTALRPAAVASYNQFCTAIQQSANLTPNEYLIALFHKLDELRKKYHALGGNGKDVPPVDGKAK